MITDEQKAADLKMISDYTNLYSDEFANRELLNFEADKGITDITNPATSTHKIANQILWIARNKLLQQMKLHTIALKGGTVKPAKRALIHAAWERFLFLAGYKKVFENNDNLLGTGDQFISFGANPDYAENKRGFPFRVRSENITKICFPTFTTALRNNGERTEARRVAIIRDYREKEALAVFPWLTEDDAGELPNDLLENADQKQGALSENKDDEENKKFQVAEIIDIDTEQRYFIGGATAKVSPVIDEGENFPYRTRNGEAYLNLVHRYCLKTSTGILNAGIFHAAFRISVLDRMLQNAGLTFELVNMNRIKIIRSNVPSADFEKKYSDALLAQQNLREGVVYLKSDENIDVSSLDNPPIVQELFQCVELLERDLGRMGIKLDDAVSDPAKTAFAIDKEFEARTDFVRSIQKRNVSEVQAFQDYAWDWMIQNVSDDCDVDLGVVARIRNKQGNMVEVSGAEITDENGEKQHTPFTAGDLAKVAREENFIIEINPESGVVSPKSYQRNLRQYRIKLLQQFGASDPLIEEILALGSLDGEEFDLDFLRENLKKAAAAQGGMRPASAAKAPSPELAPVE